MLVRMLEIDSNKMVTCSLYTLIMQSINHLDEGYNVCMPILSYQQVAVHKNYGGLNLSEEIIINI